MNKNERDFNSYIKWFETASEEEKHLKDKILTTRSAIEGERIVEVGSSEEVRRKYQAPIRQPPQ